MCHFSPVFARQQLSPGEIQPCDVAPKQVYFETNPGEAVLRQTALKRYQTDLRLRMFFFLSLKYTDYSAEGELETEPQRRPTWLR